MMLEISDVNPDIIKASKIFHFGSISLTDDPERSTTLDALKIAKQNN